MSGNFNDNMLVLGYELGYPTSIGFLAKSSVCNSPQSPLGEEKKNWEEGERQKQAENILQQCTLVTFYI